MDVALKGSSPGTATAGILLLTRARQLGLPLTVSIVGSEDDIKAVPGPAVLYAPVLASCGVGRTYGHGATVVLGGDPGKPVLCSVAPHGESGWFLVDRTGDGAHAATRAMVSLSRDERASARALSKELRKAMEGLGMSTDPAVLDVLFGAEVPVLTRLAVALRAGRSLAGGRGEPITRYVLTEPVAHDALPPMRPGEPLDAQVNPERISWILNGVSTSVRDRAEAWMEEAFSLDDDRARLLLGHISEVASHLVQLPAHSILPPLGAAEDSVAVGLKAALRADGEEDANRQLQQTYRFLGGRYVDSAPHIVEVTSEKPPVDLIPRWQWFCSEVRKARKQADAMWPNLVDPPQ